jgi:chemotaxis signal transduction protein
MSGRDGLAHEDTAGGAADWVVCTMDGSRFAIPVETVAAIAPSPPVARVPYAPAALVGAGQLDGRIVPIVDLAALLERQRGGAYDGSGEVVQLRVADGTVGLWVDKVERLARGDPAPLPTVDAAALLVGRLAAPGLAATPESPLGNVGDLVAAPAAMAPVRSFIEVAVAGRALRLPRDAVFELLDAVAWTPVPQAPAGLLGVGLLRGAALPILSLAVLLGLRESRTSGAFVAVEIGGRRALLTVDRIAGLRVERQQSGRRWVAAVTDALSGDGGDAEIIDIAGLVSDELRRLVLGFSPLDRDDHDPGSAAAAVEYLAFTIAGWECALPVGCVDRIVGPQPLMRLPRPAGAGAPAAFIAGAIELHGQIVPVAAIASRLGDDLRETVSAAGAYIVLRAAEGLGAIAVDQVRRLVRLRPADIIPAARGRDGVIAALASSDGGGVLHLIAADRRWSGG